MVHFFSVGSSLIRWELHPMSPTGPYRLAVYHPDGPTVEYYDRAIDALARQGEIEDALLARSTAVPMARPRQVGSA